MYLKIKGTEGGTWHFLHIEELEYNTTRKKCSTELLNPEAYTSLIEGREFIDQKCDQYFIKIIAKKINETKKIQISCNTQAYLLNEKGETIETLIRNFPKNV